MGINHHVVAHEYSEEELSLFLDTNYKSALRLMKAFVPGMLEYHQGNIVNISSIQSVLEKEAEDLNGDGEIHVEVQNYTIPQGDSADPQLVAAGQTKLTVDIQDGTSMIFFLSPGCYESYKDSGVLPADESEYIKFSDCTGYEEAGSPKELGDLMGALRLAEDTKLEKDQSKMDYYETNKELFEKFTGKTLRGE